MDNNEVEYFFSTLEMNSPLRINELSDSTPPQFFFPHIEIPDQPFILPKDKRKSLKVVLRNLQPHQEYILHFEDPSEIKRNKSQLIIGTTEPSIIEYDPGMGGTRKKLVELKVKIFKKEITGQSPELIHETTIPYAVFVKAEQLPDLCADLVWFNVSSSSNTAHWDRILPWLKHLWNFNFYHLDIVDSKKPNIPSDEEWDEARLTLRLPKELSFENFKKLLYWVYNLFRSVTKHHLNILGCWNQRLFNICSTESLKTKLRSGTCIIRFSSENSWNIAVRNKNGEIGQARIPLETDQLVSLLILEIGKKQRYKMIANKELWDPNTTDLDRKFRLECREINPCNYPLPNLFDENEKITESGGVKRAKPFDDIKKKICIVFDNEEVTEIKLDQSHWNMNLTEFREYLKEEIDDDLLPETFRFLTLDKRIISHKGRSEEETFVRDIVDEKIYLQSYLKK